MVCPSCNKKSFTYKIILLKLIKCPNCDALLEKKKSVLSYVPYLITFGFILLISKVDKLVNNNLFLAGIFLLFLMVLLLDLFTSKFTVKDKQE